MVWEVRGRFKREGTHVYLWLIYVDIWQKPAQCGKAIILQLKISKILKLASETSPCSRPGLLQSQREDEDPRTAIPVSNSWIVALGGSFQTAIGCHHT